MRTWANPAAPQNTVPATISSFLVIEAYANHRTISYGVQTKSAFRALQWLFRRCLLQGPAQSRFTIRSCIFQRFLQSRRRVPRVRTDAAQRLRRKQNNVLVRI